MHLRHYELGPGRRFGLDERKRLTEAGDAPRAGHALVQAVIASRALALAVHGHAFQLYEVSSGESGGEMKRRRPRGLAPLSLPEPIERSHRHTEEEELSQTTRADDRT